MLERGLAKLACAVVKDALDSIESMDLDTERRILSEVRRLRRANPTLSPSKFQKILRFHDMATKYKRAQATARDRAWLLNRMQSGPWIEAAGIDYDALIVEQLARGTIDDRAFAQAQSRRQLKELAAILANQPAA